MGPTGRWLHYLRQRRALRRPQSHLLLHVEAGAPARVNADISRMLHIMTLLREALLRRRRLPRRGLAASSAGFQTKPLSFLRRRRGMQNDNAMKTRAHNEAGAR